MRAYRHLLSFAAALALTAGAAISTARAAGARAGGDRRHLRRHRARHVRGRADDGARTLQTAVDAFLADPTDATLAAARDAWKASRVPYQQTEGFRFGNAIVDDWEGKVNAWPLDEGLIDYVDTDLYGEESEENPLYTANVIANPELRIGAGRDRREGDHAGAAGQAAGGAGRRVECRHRLPRDRVPALGPGSERHRAGLRRAAGHRLFGKRLHATKTATGAAPI